MESVGSLTDQIAPAPPPEVQAAPALPRYLNRELSQLDFVDRVLAMAEDISLPLLERVRFLAILGENVDQFFQVRVAGLKEQVHAALPQTSPDGMTTGEQLRAIHQRSGALLQRSTDLFTRHIAPALEQQGVSIASVADLDETAHDFLLAEFRARIFPVLTPLAVDPAHP